MRTRDNNFAFLHIAGAVMVIFGHCFPLLKAGPAPSFMGQSVHGLGIRLLFVISGYLCALSLERSSGLKEYYFKRITRIYPPYAACILLSVCLLYFSSGGGSLPAYLKGAWNYTSHNLLFNIRYNIPGVFEENPYGPAVNGSLWSLPVELFLQLLLPLLAWPCGRRNGTRRNVWYAGLYGIFFAATFVILRWYPAARRVYYGTDWIWAVKLGAYFFGGSFYFAIGKDGIKRYCRIWIAAFLLILAAVFAPVYSLWMTPLLLPYCVITAALRIPPVLSGFWNRHDIAYGLYLWAFPVQQVLIQMMFDRGHTELVPAVLFLLALPITAALAFMQKIGVEEPCGKLARRMMHLK